MITIRDYQQEAIDNFVDNNWNGIFEMATGTGKTITSLLAAQKYYQEQGRVFLIILVPFTHLAEQWIDNCKAFDFNNALRCYGSKKKWVYSLEGIVRDFNIDISNKELVVTTYKSATTDEFNRCISKIRNNVFLIADECHYFGIKTLQSNKFQNVSARLGLSATPDRWWDESGTKFMRDFFGQTVYEYSLEKAIDTQVLVDYQYTPFIVDLNDEEIERYQFFTRKLLFLLKEKKKNKSEIEEVNRKRSLIISKAESKKLLLYKIFSEKKIGDVNHTLVYCAPNEINDITKKLFELGYKVHRFDSQVESKDRQKILSAFSSGEIQILVAIKCLDEGVDIPSTREAYFLASTSNPREYIQRRGRILRRSKDKYFAYVYDFIVIPTNVNDALFKSIVSKELPRFAEFSLYAINHFKAREQLLPYLDRENLSDLMDKLPWEVYYEMKEKWEDLEDGIE